MGVWRGAVNSCGTDELGWQHYTVSLKRSYWSWNDSYMTLPRGKHITFHAIFIKLSGTWQDEHN